MNWLVDGLLMAMLWVAGTIVVFWLAFALASLFEGFPRLRLHQGLGMVGVSGWIFGFFNSFGPDGGTEWLVIATAVVCLLLFAGMWGREFRLLMLRRADEFPDRSDKLVWTFALTVMAPAGVWLFRSFRRARWPVVAEAAGPHPLDLPGPPDEPAVDGFGMPRIGA